MKLAREQNTDNNEGVPDELCCSTLPSATPPAQLPLTQTETAKYSWPKNDCSVFQKLSKALKFVFLPY